MILVDSSVWIDYFNGNTTIASEKLDSLLGLRPVCTGDLILIEVLQGFKSDSVLHRLKVYCVSYRFTIWQSMKSVDFIELG